MIHADGDKSERDADHTTRWERVLDPAATGSLREVHCIDELFGLTSKLPDDVFELSPLLSLTYTWKLQ